MELVELGLLLEELEPLVGLLDPPLEVADALVKDGVVLVFDDVCDGPAVGLFPRAPVAP